MDKLRIAVWHNLPSGGGKRQLYNHVQGLLERGHYVESWCPDTADQKYLPLGQLVQEHIVPLPLKGHAHYHTYRSLATTRKLLAAMEAHCKTCAAEIEAGNFDVLFANACTFLRTTPIAGYVKIPSSIYLGEPYRWFYEAMPELPWLTPLTPLQQKFTFRNVREYLQRVSFLNGVRIQARAELEYAKQFDRILVNSVFSRETILRTYNLEAKVCYLGINSDYYKPTGEQKEDIVVGLGTIYHAKGVDRAIRAIGTIAEDIRPELIWIGNGASEWELQDYQRLAKGLGVRFTPQIHISDNEVISYLSRATAMIYTSRLEPFGLAPLEANACGTPVVGIAEGGVKETIRNGINGFLACDDDPFVIGELLSRFCKDRQLALDMGKQARQHVIESWNMKTCADNIEKNLLRLLETR